MQAAIQPQKGSAMEKLGVVINLGFAFALVLGASVLMVL